MASQALMRYTCAARESEQDGWDACEVLPSLWVGSLSAAESSEDLTSHGIASVVTVASRLRPKLPESVVHASVALEDHPCADLFAALPPALAAIDAGMAAGGEEGRGVLVHCASGVSRSVAAVTAWLMTRRQYSLEAALEAVRAVRPSANPNFGFMRALQLLEASAGDVELAARKWQEASRGGLQDQVRGLREIANSFHARADEIEESLARRRSAEPSPAAPEDLRALLETLGRDIDGAAPESGLDDRVARSIRRAAAQKVARLLEAW